MAGTKWTDLETVIVLYFISRKVTQAACEDLLKDRLQASRSVVAIRSKMKDLREANPKLYEGGEWVVDEVDTWIQEQGLSQEELETARLTFDDETVEKILEVRIIRCYGTSF
ncbi:MAG: hypothetical protein M1840_006345 [Geoglossum simile]|nr:MAG: hypothetical protein M1840_006345 [Geoglossum simile]